MAYYLPQTKQNNRFRKLVPVFWELCFDVNGSFPSNLIVLIWDNEMWGQVGRQYSHTHYRTNLEEISKGSGINHTATVENMQQLKIAFSKALSSNGPWVIIAKIEEGEYLPVAPVEPEKTTYRFRESMLKNTKS